MYILRYFHVIEGEVLGFLEGYEPLGAVGHPLQAHPPVAHRKNTVFCGGLGADP